MDLSCNCTVKSEGLRLWLNQGPGCVEWVGWSAASKEETRIPCFQSGKYPRMDLLRHVALKSRFRGWNDELDIRIKFQVPARNLRGKGSWDACIWSPVVRFGLKIETSECLAHGRQDELGQN